ncbi:MAG: histidinol-phosphate transaminase [Rhodothermaceae bacterium]
MSKKTIYLDRNESYYGPAPACFDKLKNADKSLLSWYTKAHTVGVKSVLTARLSEDFNIPEKQVVLGYGAEDLLKQSVQCYLSQGSKLMIPSHSWWYYKELANEVNGENIEFPMIEGEDSYYYDVEKMLELYKEEKPEMVLISSPNNPTGNSISFEDLTRILDNTKDSIVVFDEAYGHSSENDKSKELLDKYPNLIIVRTFSKYYALAGVRIGYGFIGANLQGMDKFTKRCLGYNRISEEIALAALDSPEYYEKIAQKMNEDKEKYYNELNELEGFKVFKSEANFILVEIPEEIKASLKEYLLEKGLQIKFMNEKLLNHHLRITLGKRKHNKRLINAIKEFVQSEAMVQRV